MSAAVAGVEAALISSYLGADVCLVTMDKYAIARMSCNPAIGGLAKGQIVREIDVLGGVMAKAADVSGLQFKTLNKAEVVQCGLLELKLTKGFTKKLF